VHSDNNFPREVTVFPLGVGLEMADQTVGCSSLRHGDVGSSKHCRR
jgi:hypothetical protein